MADEVEIRAKLTLDDEAKAVLESLASGFEQADSARAQAQQGFSAFGQFTATLAAVHLPNAISATIAWGKSFVEAAAGGEQADRNLAGLITTMQDMPWEESIGMAEGLGDQLDELAITAKIKVGDAESAFHRLVEIEGASAEGITRARDNLEKMSVISRVLGKDATSIAEEFSFMGEGALKAKGQLFQLLQQTGIFGKDTKKAAAAWAELTHAERAHRLTYALTQVSDKLRNATPTFQDLLTTIDNTWEIAKEKIGEPFLKEVSPALNELMTDIGSGREEVVEFARALSKDVGVWVKDATKDVREGFRYLRDHKEEIGQAIKDAFANVKAVVQWILAHKEELAYAFGAKMAAPAVGAAASTVSSVYKAGAGATTGLAAPGGVAGGLMSVAALGAAIISLGFALDQATKFTNEWKGSLLEATGAALMGTELTDRQADAEARYAQAKKLLEKAQLGQLDTLMATMRGSGEEGRKYAAMIERQKQAFLGGENAQLMEKVKPFELVSAGAIPVTIQPLIEAYNQAATTGNVGMQRYIANLVAGSAVLSTMLKNSGLEIEGGLHEMGRNVTNAATEVSTRWKDLMKSPLDMAKGVQSGDTAKLPAINFNGGQTFKIQQDFRDQDPDRVAVVFERSISRAATARLAANTSSPFGT